MRSLSAFIFLASFSVNASVWKYSSEKDLMTNYNIYKAEIIQDDITVSFRCSYPDGSYIGIYTKSDGLRVASDKLDLRYKIDNSAIFTKKVSVFQKKEEIFFKIPKNLFFDSIDHIASGNVLKIELSDSFEDKIYRELSLKNSSNSINTALSKCETDFHKSVEATNKTKSINDSQKAYLINEEDEQIQSIKDLVLDRITENWIRPPSAKNNMKTKFRIHFSPTGEVINAKILESSENSLFDQRAIDAVYKLRKIDEISKLDSNKFEVEFRQMDLTFDPQAIRNK